MTDCKTKNHYETSESPTHNKKDNGCNVIRYMESLADQAWSELFKEKVKSHYEKAIGEKMDQYAEIVANQSVEEWKRKIENKEIKKDYEYKLFAAMKGK